jgi:hypothetical protein
MWKSSACTTGARKKEMLHIKSRIEITRKFRSSIALEKSPEIKQLKINNEPDRREYYRGNEGRYGKFLPDMCVNRRAFDRARLNVLTGLCLRLHTPGQYRKQDNDPDNGENYDAADEGHGGLLLNLFQFHKSSIEVFGMQE